jgi:flagellar basal-body rod protein FlgF
MDPLTIAAASGLRSRMDSLELLANNLANAATSGYKDDHEFYGLFTSDAQDGDSSSSTLPVVERQWTDFSQGNLLTTGSPTDVALSGRGFLSVNGPAGPIYTRNGNFHVSPSGELVTAEGFAVRSDSGGTINVGSGKMIDIATDGSVRQDGKNVARLAVVDFKAQESLKKMNGSYFENTNPRNPPVAATQTTVEQAKLEGSNVPVAASTMRLVGVMRQFEMLQKAIALSGEMNKGSVEQVARVS